MKIIVTLIGLISFVLNFGQNLIPNPSFEDTVVDCHYQRFVSPATENIGVSIGWFNPSKATPDLIGPDTICSYVGYQFSSETILPTQGNNYALIYQGLNPDTTNNWREYVATKLSSPLTIGKKYCFEYDITHATPIHGYTSNGFGIGLSNDSLSFETNKLIEVPFKKLNSEIMSTIGWTRYSIEFVVDSNYRYLYFGNFLPVDSLSYSFYGTDPNYFLAYYIIYFIDNLSLTLCPGQEPEEHFSLYPNPSNGNAIYIDKYADTTANIYLYNSIGQQVGTKELPTGAYQGAVFEHIAAGVYILIYETAVGYYEERKVVVIR